MQRAPVQSGEVVGVFVRRLSEARVSFGGHGRGEVDARKVKGNTKLRFSVLASARMKRWSTKSVDAP